MPTVRERSAPRSGRDRRRYVLIPVASVNYIDWRIHPHRADRWLAIWEPALDRALAFGATACFLSRSIDDPLLFRQVSVWDDREDFDRYWHSDEVVDLREAAFNYYNKPLAPQWHSLTAEPERSGEPNADAPSAARAAPS